MYANLKNIIFHAIPGCVTSDLIYLGMIVFIIAGFISGKKWTPFVSTVIFAVVIKALDIFILHQDVNGVLEQFLHIILLPGIITLLYSKRA